MMFVAKSAHSFASLLAKSSYYSIGARSLAVDAKKENNKYVPRRAVMYVPGNDWKKINKIPSLRADSFILDCEDGVALNRKEEARKNIYKIFKENLINPIDFECAVRVNAIDSGLCEIDLDTILQGPTFPTTLHLPKLESKEQLEWLAEKLQDLLGGKQKLKLIVFIESARALLQMEELLGHAAKLHAQSAPFTLEAAVFGSDDFCADIGATRTPEATELLYARQRFVTVAKAFRIQAIDLVYTNFKDPEGLLRQSLEGSNMGFTGKQVIHPSQIEVVQRAFTPSTDKINWAQELVTAFNEHQNSGKGAFTFRGHMIDMPLLLQARNILQVVDHLRLS